MLITSDTQTKSSFVIYLFVLGKPDQTDFAWGPHLISCPAHSLPSTSTQIIALTGRPVSPYLAKLLGSCLQHSNVVSDYNWEQNKLSGRKNPDESEHAVLRSRDDRLVEMAYLHADPVSILPLLKTAFILVAIDKKLIAVTSLWNRSLDTMG